MKYSGTKPAPYLIVELMVSADRSELNYGTGFYTIFDSGRNALNLNVPKKRKDCHLVRRSCL